MSEFYATDTAVVVDGLQSTIHAMGTERDKSASLYFQYKGIPDDQLIAAYECNWMVRNVVDIPPMDSLRKGWRWAEKHDEITAEENRLDLVGKLMQAYKKGRLLGGAALYIGTEQDPAEPLEVGKIPRGGLKHLNVITRLQLNAGETETDIQSEYYGHPREYYLTNNAVGHHSQGNFNASQHYGQSSRVVIHPSRLVLFNGDERADIMHTTTSNGWPGISVIQSTLDAITDAQSTMSNVSSLVHEANIDVLSIPDLMSNIGDEEYKSKILKRAALLALSKGINGMGVMDVEEELTRKPASFSNLPQLMEGFAVLVAAAAQIPSTRFLAQSPSGLVATGESDMNNYHDLIQSKQILEIDPATPNLRHCLTRSALGTDEVIPHTWEPLKQMTEQELSEIGERTAKTVKTMQETGAITGEDARALLRHRLSENGSFPNIEEVLDKALGSLDPNAET